MTDKPLSDLDHAGRWRLACDSQQWIVQRRVGKPRPVPSGSSAGASSGWKAVSFIGGTKRVLHRCLREAGVVLTPTAQAQLAALPDTFVVFAAPVVLDAAA